MMVNPFENGDLRLRDLALGAAIATAVIGAYTGPAWLSVGALMIAVLLIWLQSTWSNLLWYAATVSYLLPQPFVVGRLAMADLFMLPVVTRGAFNWWRTRGRVPPSAMLWPLALLLIAFATATLVGYQRLGRVTTWAFLNKDAGIVLLVAVFVALTACMRTAADVMRLARWYVVGVSVGNAAALIGVATALAGLDNVLYPGNSRLYGWMLNPSVNGGLLLTAAMIELGLLAESPVRGERRWIRWLNVWLLGIGLALTLSRSTWTSIVAGSAMLLFVLLRNQISSRETRRPHMAAVAVWMIIPALALGNIVLARGGVTITPPAQVAAELQQRLVGQCVANPSLDICKDVQMQATAPPPAPAAAAPAAAPVERADVAGPMMNARGLNDRVAIIAAAWNAYNVSAVSRLFGIGLGTFYATSGGLFGVPLIIHNTFAWFLVELGPLGLILVLWVWVQTAANLWIAGRTPFVGRYLAWGATGAFAGLTMFCVFNEGFYQRALWLIFAMADRLRLIADSEAVADGPVSIPLV